MNFHASKCIMKVYDGINEIYYHLVHKSSKAWFNTCKKKFLSVSSWRCLDQVIYFDLFIKSNVKRLETCCSTWYRFCLRTFLQNCNNQNSYFSDQTLTAPSGRLAKNCQYKLSEMTKEQDLKQNLKLTFTRKSPAA